MEQQKQEILSRIIKESLEEAEAKGVRKGLCIALAKLVNYEENDYPIIIELKKLLGPITYSELKDMKLSQEYVTNLVVLGAGIIELDNEKETTEGSQKSS